MFKKLKRKLKDYIKELSDIFTHRLTENLYFRYEKFEIKELYDDFFQITINVSKPIDFGIELDSFFCYLEQEDKSTDLSIVSIIPVDKNTYLVTFKQN